MQIRQEGDRLCCRGQLCPGAYSLPGNVSSQYISGLLLALPLLKGDSSLHVTGTVESAAYITMTEDALRTSGIRIEKNHWNYGIAGSQKPRMPASLPVESDWSNAAFFLYYHGLTQQNCAKVLAVSQVQISRLEKRAVDRLRERLQS